jgi:hypothetical protein
LNYFEEINMPNCTAPSLSTYRDGPSLGPQIASWIEFFLVDDDGRPSRITDATRKQLFRIYALDADGERRFSEDELHPAAPVQFDHWAQEGELSHWGYAYRPGEPVGTSPATGA